MIIDAHHHFWDPTRVDYPWMTDDLAAIRRPFGPEDLAPLLTANGVDRTVLVQTRSSVVETREFLEIARDTDFVAGVVGWVDLTDPGIDDTLVEIRRGPGGDRLVAIRHQVHDELNPGWLVRVPVRRGLAAIARANLTLDLLVRTRELPAALAVAREFPSLRLVVDHLAKPPIRDGAYEPWASRIQQFAGLTNVWCKLSGLVTEASWERWTAADLTPYVRHVLDVFGPDRLLFGSDWPVCLLAAPYEAVISAARSLTADLSDSESKAVFGGTAATVYRLAE